MASSILQIQFFRRPALEVAPDLVGRDLCVQVQGEVLRVRLCDVEAYHQHERACHAFGGRKTVRNRVMFEAGGVSYVYFVYGMHWILNFVTGKEGVGEAVMVRGAIPLEGLERIRENRNFKKLRYPPTCLEKWLQGPAKVAQGLGVHSSHNGLPLQPELGIWLESGSPPSCGEVRTGPRIGVQYAGADAALPWRFFGKIVFHFILVLVPFLVSCQSSPNRVDPVEKRDQVRRLTLEDQEYFHEIQEDLEKFNLKIPQGEVAYLLYDPSTRRILDHRAENQSFIPASTTKILTTVAALKILGPQFRFRTQVAYSGEIKKNTLVGDLYLKGSGDPSLFASHLWSLMRSLSDHGIQKVIGNFYYDESEVLSQSMIRLDGDKAAAHNPGVGALSVDFNQLLLQWSPNLKTQSILDVKVTPDFPLVELGFFTDPKRGQKSDEIVSLQEELQDDSQDQVKEKWLFSSSISSHGEKRIPIRHPSFRAALLFSQFCRMNGILLSSPQSQMMPKNVKILGVHQSPPLLDLVERALEYSNNLMAELILLAAARQIEGQAVTLEKAAQILKKWLTQEVVSSSWDSLELVNGSGLSPMHRITAQQLVSILEYIDPFRFDNRSYESLLPIAGWKGTLSSRLSHPEAQFRVWAKTGSLFYVTAIAGYLYPLSGKRLIFAILCLSPGKRKAFNRLEELPQSLETQADSWNKRVRQKQDILLRKWIVKF